MNCITVPWWQHWINVGYNSAKRGGTIESAAVYPPKIAKYVRKGFAKWDRHIRRVERKATLFS